MFENTMLRIDMNFIILLQVIINTCTKQNSDVDLIH